MIAPSVLGTGGTVKLKHALLSLTEGEPESGSVELPALRTAEPAPAAPAAIGPRRLRVTDGGDQGRSFPLPEAGTLTVGKAGGHADIGLHDLYVAKLHCTLQIDDGTITVTHLEAAARSQIDGDKITGPQLLNPGSVLRVGNSHLRLEVGPFADEPPAPAPEPPKSGVLRAPPAAPKSSTKAEDPLAALAGQTLGHYQTMRLLGRGHM